MGKRSHVERSDIALTTQPLGGQTPPSSIQQSSTLVSQSASISLALWQFSQGALLCVICLTSLQYRAACTDRPDFSPSIATTSSLQLCHARWVHLCASNWSRRLLLLSTCDVRTACRVRCHASRDCSRDE